MQYVEQYGNGLDGRRFSVMSLSVDVHEISNDCYGHLQDTSMGTSIKCWSHWGGRRATHSLRQYSGADSSYVCCFKHVVDKQRLNIIFLWVPSVLHSNLPKDPGEVFGLSRVYDQIHFFSIWRYWPCSILLQYCMRFHTRGVLLLWQDQNRFCRASLCGASFIPCTSVVVGTCGVLPPSNRSLSSFLSHSTTLAFRDRPDAAAVFCIAVIELDAMVLLQFLSAARGGVVGFECFSLRMYQDGFGVFASLFLTLTVT